MKNIIGTTAMLVAASLFAATAASAEITLMRAEIPFPFVVGDKTLPAGTYLIRSGDATGRIEMIGRGVTNEVALFSAPALRSDKASGVGLLMFNTYGNVHILRKVWAAGQWRGHLLPVSRLEKQFARRSATAGRPVATVFAISR